MSVQATAYNMKKGLMALKGKQTLKKNGQQYTRRELLSRGWTQELINTNLTAQRKPNGQVYFRASDVSAALKTVPDLRKTLIQNFSEKEMIKNLQTVPISVRLKQAVLAPGENRHSGPGENRQFWPGENRQSLFTI